MLKHQRVSLGPCMEQCVKQLLHVARQDTWDSKQAGTLMQQQKFWEDANGLDFVSECFQKFIKLNSNYCNS